MANEKNLAISRKNENQSRNNNHGKKASLLNSPKLKILNKNQYGFKHKTFCNHSIFTVKETILHYTENDPGVIVASLDAEKEFY
jgi:hypothetical protein